MQVQPITNHTSFKGKVVFEKNIIPEQFSGENYSLLDKKFKEIANLVSDKPYDLFIMRNKQNPDFYDIAANKTLKQAKKVKEYTVKIQSGIILDSIVDAAKDAMEMYEKYITRSVKG